MDLFTVAHPDHPVLDMALSGALLEAVASGKSPAAIRIYQPGPTVAFGRLDRLRPGFTAACRTALLHGRTPVLRLGGGRAVAYDRDCIVVEILRRRDTVPGGLEERFDDLARLLEDGLARAGIRAERGELPGEYCPGRFSLHLPDGPKIAGVAQRVVSGASLATAVLAVGNGSSLRATITDVYAALGVTVDPATAGAVQERYPDVSTPDVMTAVVDEARLRYGAAPAEVPTPVRERTAALLGEVDARPQVSRMSVSPY